MKGPNSWEGRPRDTETIRVSTLPKKLHDEFKKTFGSRRWTTPWEVERLEAMMRYRRIK